jgi:hypothetical protein
MLPMVRVLATVSFAATRFAGQEDQQPGDEVGQLVGRDVLSAEALGQVAAQAVDGEQRLRVGPDPEDERVRVVAAAEELAALGGHQVVLDAVRVGAERDPLHRLGDVVVEAREEPEAVLAREIRPTAGARPRDADAAGLAAPGARLEDGHLEAALGQLVGGRQTGHATPEDRDAGSGGRGEGRHPQAAAERGRAHGDTARAQQCAALDRAGGLPVELVHDVVRPHDDSFDPPGSGCPRR